MSDDTDGNFNKFLIEAKHMKKLTEEIMMDIEGGKISLSLIPSLIIVRHLVMKADNNYYQKGKFRKQYNWFCALIVDFVYKMYTPLVEGFKNGENHYIYMQIKILLILNIGLELIKVKSLIVIVLCEW